MSQVNSARKGCKDVFRAFLVKNATYESELEIPCISAEEKLPSRLIPFSKAVGHSNPDAWVHFYEDDVEFERLWNTPNKYLSMFKRFSGIITPDFSLYRDMPLVMQQWNIYRSRAIGHWLQENGVPVIVNVRWGDNRTFDLCCAGVPKNATIAVGSHGCIKLLRERKCFEQGLKHVVKSVQPKTIIVYGSAPDFVFNRYKESGITIIQFESVFKTTHRKAVGA